MGTIEVEIPDHELEEFRRKAEKHLESENAFEEAAKKAIIEWTERNSV